MDTIYMSFGRLHEKSSAIAFPRQQIHCIANFSLFSLSMITLCCHSNKGRWVLKSNKNKYQRTNGPVNAHLISWPSKAKNIQNLENIW